MKIIDAGNAIDIGQGSYSDLEFYAMLNQFFNRDGTVSQAMI